MDWLQMACNLIILIGGAVIAVQNIFSWFGKPIRFFQKKADKEFEEKVTAIVKIVVPQILSDDLTEISTLKTQYDALAISARDVLREKIMKIYQVNKDHRSLSTYEREALNQYYIDYKAIHGNSYIDKYYERMKSWKTDEDDYDMDLL